MFRKVILNLEAKVLESERKFEAIKKSMIEIQSDKREDIIPPRCGYEYCHNRQEEVKSLQVKLDDALQPKIVFAIDPSKVEKHLNYFKNKHRHMLKDSNSKDMSHKNLSCHYCCKKGHTIEKCKFRKLFVPKGAIQWLPKSNYNLTHSQGPNENLVPIAFV